MRRPHAITSALAVTAALWAGLPGNAFAGNRHRGPGHSATWVRVVQVHPGPPPRAWSHPCGTRHGGHWGDHWDDHGHRRGFSGPAPIVTYRPYRTSGGREFLGTVIGGAVGGVVGSTIGKGSGRTAAVVGGTVLGVLVGGSVGRSMDAVDRLYLDRTLETVPSRSSVAWQNPDTRTAYEVTPLATYQEGDRYCREYTATAQVAGKPQQIYGTACRQPDGSWELVR